MSKQTPRMQNILTSAYQTIFARMHEKNLVLPLAAMAVLMVGAKSYASSVITVGNDTNTLGNIKISSGGATRSDNITNVAPFTFTLDGTATFTMSGTLINAAGATIIGGGNAVVTITGNTINNGAFTINDNAAITANTFTNNGSAVMNGGVASFSGAVTNAGTLVINKGALSANGSFNNLGSITSNSLTNSLVVGNLNGGAGSSITLPVVLAGDSSAAGVLKIGSSTGTTQVYLSKAAGSIGSGTLYGIKLIDVSGTSAAGSISMNPIYVGQYKYRLKQGKDISASHNSAQSWYLVNNTSAVGPNGIVEPIPGPAGAPSSGGNGGSSSANGGGGGGGGFVNPTAGAIGAITPAAFQIGGILLLSQSNRMGEISDFINLDTSLRQDDSEQKNLAATYLTDITGGQAPAKLEDDTKRVWGRVGYQQVKLEGETASNQTQKYVYVQAGIDLFRSNETNSLYSNVFGVSLGYSNSKADYSQRDNSDPSSGQSTSNFYSLGAYFSHVEESGAYLTIAVDGNMLNTDHSDAVGSGQSGGTQKGVGFGTSIEFGRPYQVAAQWRLEPQAEIIYQHFSFNSFESSGSAIDGYSADSLIPRLGGRAVWIYSPGNLAYVSANLYKELIKAPSIVVDGYSSQENINDAFWGEIGLGGQLRASNHWYVYGKVSYEHSLGGNLREGYTVNIGTRYAW